MSLALARPGNPSTDQADSIVSLGVDDNQEPAAKGLPDENEAILVLRVARIRNRDRKRIAECRGSLLEVDAVLAAIRRRLPRIPLEVQTHDDTGR